MLTVDAALTVATEKGMGTPIFYIILYHYIAGDWSDIGLFDVIQAKTTRLRYDIRVQEDLIGGSSIVTASGLPYAVAVVRGLSVAGTDYTFTSHKYFISKADYLINEGYTDLVCDLLPTAAIRDITADVEAGSVIGDALAFVNVDDFVVDVSKDVWYYWQFYPTTKTLNLSDARQLSGLIANKYFAYFFPREEGLICHNVPSNFENAEEGHYTPFTHARIRKTVSADHNLNLSWVSETGKQYLTRSTDYAYHSLGFISDVDDPASDAYFPEWGQTFQHPTYQIEQRPDFRLEQGDLVQFSMDSFDQVRCIDLVEFFKRGKDAHWKQIITDLPYHPQASAVRIGDFPDDPTPKPSASNILTITDNFNHALSAADSTIQAALDTLDEYIELRSGWRIPNETWIYDSASSFKIAGDVSAIYSIGDKIKLTQTTVKYFSVVGVVYSSSWTTITVTAGSDHTLANAAITDIFYSKVVNPDGFPDLFNVSLSFATTYFDNGSGGAITAAISKFRLNGRQVFHSVVVSGNSYKVNTNTVWASFTIPSSMPTPVSFYGGVGSIGLINLNYVVTQWALGGTGVYLACEHSISDNSLSNGFDFGYSYFI